MTQPSTTKNIAKKVLLVIMDGLGVRDESKDNAVFSANTPHLDQLTTNYPYTTITAGGVEVGLPKGVAGNSEVGHMNIGAGRPVEQDLVVINKSIASDDLKNRAELLNLINSAMAGSKRIHLMGLLSDGGVHSHIDHLKALMKIFANYKELSIYFHAFMDGRDTAPNVGAKYVKDLIDSAPYNFHFASMQGRSIGMDRDRRWEKIKQCYQTMTGKGAITTQSPLEYLAAEYSQNIFDEFITPVSFMSEGNITANDYLFCINFRPDRAIQLTTAFCAEEFKEFDRDFKAHYYLCMTPYVQDEIELPILFGKSPLCGGLSETLSRLKLKQCKIAETEKFAHITFFFNGGRKDAFAGEDRILVPSPRDVATYDLKPEMSAAEIVQKLIPKLQDDKYSFYLVNFANSDMVGHTGNFSAAVKAVETVDQAIGQLMQVCEQEKILMIVTADHGNSDQMAYTDGTPHTSHTNSQVPLAYFHPLLKNYQLSNDPPEHFSLKDIAPSILYSLGKEIPKNFTGRPIFK